MIYYLQTNIPILIYFSGTFTFEVKNRGKTSQSISLTGGMIEASRMIEYLYQIKYSLPKKENIIIPNIDCDFTFESGNTTVDISYNPLEVILDASNSCLLLHQLLSRRYYTQQDLKDVQRMISLTQIIVHRLFILKQLVSNSTQGTSVLKTHILFHFVQCIRIWGYPKIFNLDKTESAHTQLKEDFAHSSKKLSQFNELLQMNRYVLLTQIYKLSYIFYIFIPTLIYLFLIKYI
jgi:hypothetical protein